MAKKPTTPIGKRGAAATAPRPARYLSTRLGDDGVRTWSVIGRVGMPECRDGALREALSTFHRNTPQHELLLREANVPVWDGNLRAFGTLGAWERTHSCGFPDCTDAFDV